MALLSTVSRSNWNLEMLVIVEGAKAEYPEKNPRSRDENQQQTQPTYDTETGNRTRAEPENYKQFSLLSLPSLLPNQQSDDQILELLLIFSKSPQHQKNCCSYKIGAKT